MLVNYGYPGLLPSVSPNSAYLEQVRNGNMYQCLAIFRHRVDYQRNYGLCYSDSPYACNLGSSITESSAAFRDGHLLAGLAVSDPSCFPELTRTYSYRTSIISLVRLVTVIKSHGNFDFTCTLD